MFSKLADRLLPRDGRAAFFRGFGMSLVLGLAIVFIAGPLTGLSSHFGGNARNGIHDGYWELATNLGRGHGYVFEPGGPPVMHRPPLVPLLLVPVTLLPVLLERPVVILIQSLMVGGACYLLFDITQKTLGTRIARWSVGLLLLYPWLYLHVKNPMNVIAQMLSVLWVLDLVGRELRFGQSEKRGLSASWCRRAVLLGLAVATAVLTHATMLASIPLLLLLMAAAGAWRGRLRPAAAAAVAVAVAAVVVAPWTYRNGKVTGHFMPVAGNGGFAYFWGNAHWALGGDIHRGGEIQTAFALAGIDRKPEDVVQFWGIVDPGVDRQFNRKMIEHIKSHPAQLARKIVLNGAEYYFPVVYDLIGPRTTWHRLPVSRRVERVAISLWHLALWGLAVVGLWRWRASRKGPYLLAALACVAALACPYFPFLVRVDHSQYVVATIPILAVLAAAGLDSLSGERDTSESEAAPGEVPADPKLPGSPGPGRAERGRRVPASVVGD